MRFNLAGVILFVITLSTSNAALANSCIDENAIQSVRPAPFPLVKIISEPENMRIHKINLFLNDLGDILGLSRESGDDIQVICPEELFEREVLLAKASGIDAVFLGCRDCTIYDGGIVNIRYLYNGALSSYRNFEMQLVRDDDTNWSLQTMDGDQIDKLTLLSRRILGKVIGIGAIKVN